MCLRFLRAQAAQAIPASRGVCHFSETRVIRSRRTSLGWNKVQHNQKYGSPLTHGGKNDKGHDILLPAYEILSQIYSLQYTMHDFVVLSGIVIAMGLIQIV